MSNGPEFERLQYIVKISDLEISAVRQFINSAALSDRSVRLPIDLANASKPFPPMSYSSHSKSFINRLFPFYLSHLFNSTQIPLILAVRYDVLILVSTSIIYLITLSLNNAIPSTRLLQLISLFYASPHSHSIAYIFSPMSQSGPSMFSADARSTTCSTCGRLVEFKPCISNRNGNKGVLFATVRSSPIFLSLKY